MKTIELTEQEEKVVRLGVEDIRDNFDGYLRRGESLTPEVREEEINAVRICESILKKLGDK